MSSSLTKYENKTSDENMVWVDVYLNTGSITEITEKQAIGLLDLMSNVGGSLGLFLGLSFLSLVEIFVVLIESIHHFNEKLKLKKKK